MWFPSLLNYTNNTTKCFALSLLNQTLITVGINPFNTVHMVCTVLPNKKSMPLSKHSFHIQYSLNTTDYHRISNKLLHSTAITYLRQHTNVLSIFDVFVLCCST